jgi:hypothetical protein
MFLLAVAASKQAQVDKHRDGTTRFLQEMSILVIKFEISLVFKSNLVFLE